MAEKDLIPGEYENEVVNRLAALLAQKLSVPGDKSKPNFQEEQRQEYSNKISQILSDSGEALRIIKDAEVREREGLKRRIIKIAQRLDFKVESAVRLDSGAIVDIAFKKNHTALACFIFNCGCLSCEPDVIRLCLQSGFDHVLICTLGKVQTDRLSSLLGETIKNIAIVALSDLDDYLHHIGWNDFRTECFFKGRKVVVEYRRVSKQEEELKSNTIKRILSKGF